MVLVPVWLASLSAKACTAPRRRVALFRSFSRLSSRPLSCAPHPYPFVCPWALRSLSGLGCCKWYTVNTGCVYLLKLECSSNRAHHNFKDILTTPSKRRFCLSTNSSDKLGSLVFSSISGEVSLMSSYHLVHPCSPRGGSSLLNTACFFWQMSSHWTLTTILTVLSSSPTYIN